MIDSINSLPFKTRGLLLLSCSLLLTLFIVSPNLFNGWVSWDDAEYVLNNELVQDFSMKGIYHVFGEISVMGNYHPISLLSLMFDYSIGNSDATIYHLHNVLLHLANVTLVFLLSYLLSGNLTICFLTSLLFGIHPMHHEVVVWISARKDLLCTFYFFSSLIAYCLYCKHQKQFLFYVSLFLFLLALLSKAVAVTLPLVLLLIDYKNEHLSKKGIVDKSSFFLLSLLFGFIAIYSQSLTEALTYESYPLFQSFFAGCYALLVYTIKAFLPFHLSPFHPYPTLLPAQHPWYVYLSIIPILAVFGLIWKSKKSDREFLFGVIFFVICISPLLQIFPVGNAIISERYSYIPYFGIFLILSRSIDRFLKGELSLSLSPAVAKSVILVYFSYLGIITVQLADHWKNTEALWTRVIAQYPDNFFGYLQRGILYMNTGRPVMAMNDFTKSRLYNPYFPGIFELRAMSKLAMEDAGGARQDLDTLLDLDPDNVDGLALRGQILSNLGDHIGAVHDLNRTVSLTPSDPRGYLFRAVALERLGHLETALLDYTTGISLDPSNALAYNARGLVLFGMGHYPESLSDLDMALQIQPQLASAYYRRAQVKRKMGDFAESLIDFQQAKSLGASIDIKVLDSLRTEITDAEH